MYKRFQLFTSAVERQGFESVAAEGAIATGTPGRHASLKPCAPNEGRRCRQDGPWDSVSGARYCLTMFNEWSSEALAS
jgi:hypothetical protein